MLKNKKIILLSGVFILIAITVTIMILIINMLKNTSNQTIDNQNKIEQEKVQKIINTSKTVRLTEKGFEPNEITIEVGTRIIWTNNSGVKGSVNSDPYPINNYWKFLNLGIFEDGQNFTLIFEKTGKYSYHNQYKPDQKGTIIVK